MEVKGLMPSVLVVEDFADGRQMLVDWFRSRGFRVLEATNGWQAVEIAVRELPQVIIMDLNLPVLDGFEAALLLRANDQLQKVPIIATTGYDTADSRLDVADVGFSEYITKPIDLERLEGVITRLLASR